MIFTGTEMGLKREIKILQPISDPAELLRNVSTIQDWLERRAYWEKFTGKMDEIKDKLNPFINFLN